MYDEGWAGGMWGIAGMAEDERSGYAAVAVAAAAETWRLSE